MSAPGRRVLYCDGATSGVRRMVDTRTLGKLAFVTAKYNSIEGWQSIIFPILRHRMYINKFSYGSSFFHYNFLQQYIVTQVDLFFAKMFSPPCFRKYANCLISSIESYKLCGFEINMDLN